MSEVTRQTLYSFLRARQTRLAASYLAIIAVLTLLFSGVLYMTSAQHFDRFAPPPVQFLTPQDTLRRNTFQKHRTEAVQALVLDLISLNLVVICGGAVFSYYLAGRTLEPIEAAMRAQSQFISDASHELRTPLATLQTSNEVALRTTKRLSSDLHELLESNIAQVEKLRNLTDGLLGLIKAENSAPKFESVAVSEIIDDVMKTLGPVAASKSVTMVYSLKIEKVVTDRSSLTRVVQILCDNAIKYSPNHTTIMVAAKKHAGRVEVAVSDQGIGIAPENLLKIFERFYRADESRSTQHTEGYGIGLSIAKTLCERIGAELSVSSELKKGSTFTISLPEATN